MRAKGHVRHRPAIAGLGLGVNARCWMICLGVIVSSSDGGQSCFIMLVLPGQFSKQSLTAALSQLLPAPEV